MNEHQKHWQRLDSEERLILIAHKCNASWVLREAGAIAADDVGVEFIEEVPEAEAGIDFLAFRWLQPSGT